MKPGRKNARLPGQEPVWGKKILEKPESQKAYDAGHSTIQGEVKKWKNYI